MLFITLITICIISVGAQEVKVSQVNNATIEQNKTVAAEKKPLQLETEGGNVNVTSSQKAETPPLISPTGTGREHEIPPNVNSTSVMGGPSIQLTNNNVTQTLNVTAKLPPPVASPEKDTHTVLPRKGVTFMPPVSVSSTTEPVKKPLITENDEEPVPSSNISNVSSLNPHSVDNLEILKERQEHRTAKYVIPIVGVILSVPLMTVLISVLYKRGSEWWQHRHYRRMDFLIEGMYNN